MVYMKKEIISGRFPLNHPLRRPTYRPCQKLELRPIPNARQAKRREVNSQRKKRRRGIVNRSAVNQLASAGVFPRLAFKPMPGAKSGLCSGGSMCAPFASVGCKGV
ncbi:hypothetical protein EJ02DRAFT_17707 [Clathrospora elynae]|uniref:Uncharacterized protein n=1 Tax=Clathrospora elynae TaxID=706981 RepID=A0A6A5SG25_9PLEO|nr:hypothetical protein EJ02DRAFT_17707 [Clathrospora elynae]